MFKVRLTLTLVSVFRSLCRNSALLLAVALLTVVTPAYGTHIPTHPPANAVTLLDLNPPGFVTPLPPGAFVLSPFFDGNNNPLGLYHWETEIWNLGGVVANFVAGWFAPDGGFPVIRRIMLAPGAGVYAHLHVQDLAFPGGDVGPRVHWAFNGTLFFLGFDASIRELVFPFAGTDPGLEEISFLDCLTGCSEEVTTDPAEFSFQAIPEPSSIVLVVIGVLSVLGYGWRKRKKAA
jgi:hypothetical protein